MLVAFVLMSVTLAVLFQVFSGGLRLSAQAGEYATALRLAQSQLALAGVEEPLQVGETRGDFGRDGYRWRQTVAPHEWIDGGLAQPAGLDAFLVTLEVYWGEARPRSLQLTTLRVVASR
ncbi:general secretion pathway protein H [Thioalkalivibrio nitratireducens DSM 14787]|uniref:General secretion pathway protein H n=1 Tax=Thioalkalivibrio nitratireducens (strain DSM 14787 / UNIQEM 213 / ALEN2) TaxID=1255043 RepID=L0DYZ0_THIND|nr:general secretion pathway protein H [Thioalkalivibrio nitratireducens DSM 14787]